MKVVGVNSVQIEKCFFQKKVNGLLLACPNKRNYHAGNIAKVISGDSYEGMYVAFLRNRVKRFDIEGEKIFVVPMRDIICTVEPSDDEEVMFEKDFVDYRHGDDKTL